MTPTSQAREIVAPQALHLQTLFRFPPMNKARMQINGPMKQPIGARTIATRMPAAIISSATHKPSAFPLLMVFRFIHPTLQA